MNSQHLFIAAICFMLGVNAGIFIGFMLAYRFGGGLHGMKQFIDFMEGGPR